MGVNHMLVLLFLFTSAWSDTLPAIVIRGSSANQTLELPVSGKSAATLGDALRSVPGLTIMRAGGPGQPSAVFIRGASAEHTLVLIDGVEVNDASSPAGAFDFSTLDLNLVERIEIYKGPQSLRFGSGASAGVINVITRMGPRGPFARVRGGSYQTHQQSAGWLGGHYALGVSRFDTQGFSAVRKGSEADGFRQESAAGKFRWGGPDLGAELSGRFTGARAELDFGPLGDADDPDYVSRTRRTLFSARGFGNWSEDLRGEILISRQELARDYRTGGFREDHSARNWRVDAPFAWRTHSHVNLEFGPSFREERGAKSEATSGFFSGLSFARESDFAELGLRVDRHSRFGSFNTYAATLGGEWGGTRFTARAANGFKAPSLYQLHEPAFGNAELKAETVSSIQLGVNRELTQGLLAGLTLYRQSYRDLIVFDGRYVNRARADVPGGEFELILARERWNASLGAAYTDTSLPRRPRWGWSAGVDRLGDTWDARVEYRGVGRRRDIDAFTGAPFELSSFDTLAAEFGWSFRPKWRTSFEIENAFDRDYQEVAGFGAAGLGAYAGVAYAP